jgi:hypothetical protein
MGFVIEAFLIWGIKLGTREFNDANFNFEFSRD